MGTTDDPDRRLFEHNSGTFDDAFTRKGIPWTLFLIIDGLESNQAYKIEQHIKKMKSRKYFQNLLHFPEIIDKLKLKYR